MRTLLFATAICGMIVPALAQEENAVPMDQVPQAAKDAAMAQANGVTFDKVQIDNDEGTETFEFSGKMPDGMMLEIDVLADGTVEEVEKQIDKSKLPEAVAKALNEKLPNFEPSFIEESTRPNNVIMYEFEGTHDGKEIDAEVNADGSNFTMNEDTAG